MEQLHITQMTPYELENLIEKILIKVLNNYVDKKPRQTFITDRNVAPADPRSKILNFEQACQFLGYSKSTMYKKTSAGILPFSKPNCKKLYFDREKLEAWMLGNASTSLQEKQIKAATHVSVNPYTCE